MATIIDIATKDFEQIFPSILKNGRVDLTVEDLLEESNSYVLEELEFLKAEPSVIENERKSLENFIKLMEESEEPVEYDETINQRLLSFILAYPGIKSFDFFHIRYIVSHYADGGLDQNKLSKFYPEIFNGQSELIQLTDFFERSDFLIPLLLLENPPIDLATTFQYAVTKYPEKALLKFTLGRIYEMQDETTLAINWYLKFIEQVESERIYNAAEDKYVYIGDYSIEDFHIALSTVGRLFYKNEDYENASLYSEICLEEYCSNDEDVYSFQFLFLDPMLTRLRLCMYNKDHDGFKQDYILLRSRMDDTDFEKLDIDDIKVLANGLKM